MQFLEIGSFRAVHRDLPWPWLSIDVHGRRFAFPGTEREIATRALIDGTLQEGPTFSLPGDLALPVAAAGEAEQSLNGLCGFSLHTGGEHLALVGNAGGQSVLVTLGLAGEIRRSLLATLLANAEEPSLVARAVGFDRTGARVWISAESTHGSALLLVDALTHELAGVVRSAAFPPPAFHELYVHPVDDAVLLLVACGQAGTFARVAGFAGGPPVQIVTPLDDGAVPAGFVGFSADAARVHLVESDELRTHAWPGLQELSSVPLADDFVSSYTGVVLGQRIFIDGHHEDAAADLPESSTSDAIMLFDRSALRGGLVRPPVPTGMWAGRLGADCIVTISARGEPAEGRVVRVPELRN